MVAVNFGLELGRRLEYSKSWASTYSEYALLTLAIYFHETYNCFFHEISIFLGGEDV